MVACGSGATVLKRLSGRASFSTTSRPRSQQLIRRKICFEFGDKDLKGHPKRFHPRPDLKEVESSLTSLVFADFALGDPKPISQVTLCDFGSLARVHEKAQQHLLLF